MAVLRWGFDWGNSCEHWEKVLSMGMPVPDPFVDRPELIPEAVPYWTAYTDLMTDRQIGMGLGPIPFSKAREYARHAGFDTTDEEWEKFWSIIQTVDANYLKLMNTTMKDGTPGSKSNKRAL